MDQLSVPSTPTSSRDRLMRIGAVLLLVVLIASGWIALLVAASGATKREKALENTLAAAQAEYAQKEKLAHLTDPELAVAQAKAYGQTIVTLKPEEKLSNFRIQKISGGFATVFADYPSGGGPATYLKKVDGLWTVMLVSSDPLDSDTKAKYGMPADY